MGAFLSEREREVACNDSQGIFLSILTIHLKITSKNSIMLLPAFFS